MATKLTSQQFGRYRLLERLATGGMAEIWRAQTLGVAGFERLVAVKKILPQFGSSREFVKNLTAEATLAAQLSHANVVQIFDYDQVGGVYYLAMELVEGKDLRQILRRAKERGRPLSAAQATYIVCEVLKALSYAHERKFPERPGGLLHRDITPQNILISYQGEVKLAAFGTGDAVLLGELAPKSRVYYSAPEQLLGGPVDARSDLFMLGAIFYQMLTGERPFAAETREEALAALKGPAPAAPSAKNASVPKELDPIVLSLLERDPARRPQSAREAQRAVANFLHAFVKDFSAVDLSSYVGDLFMDESGSNIARVSTERLPGRAPGGLGGIVAAAPDDETGSMPRPPGDPGAKSPVVWGVAGAIVIALGLGGYFLLFWS
jgi:serine/threonine protein kinase